MTILSESTRDLSGIVVLLICFSVGFLIMAIAGVMLDSQSLATMGAILYIILGISAVICSRQNPQMEYKVVLDDTYPAKELLKSYDVVEQDGEIYILKAKESDSDDDPE